jgi:hypothetical protein
MTYELCELIEVGEAGSTIQGPKPKFFDELAGTTGPKDIEFEEE